MGLKNLTIVFVVVLAIVAVLPGAALAQEATPAVSGPAQSEIEIPGARIIALSPDGTRFVAGTPAENRPSQLCVYDVATLTEQACGDLDEREIGVILTGPPSVVWSPDSTMIAFTEDAFITFRDGDLWVMDAATGELTNLTDDGFEGGGINPDNYPSTPVYFDVLPAWAPDSGSIAFSRSPVNSGEFQGNEIASVDLASGEVETLLSVTSEVPGVVYFGLAWAPDGGRLYYSVAYPDSDDAQNGVWVYDRASGQTQHILENDPEKGPPALLRVAATGQTGLIFYPIYFGQFDAQGDVYALLDLESHALSPITPEASDLSSPAFVRVATFSPDGTRLLYGQFQFEDSAGRFLMRPLPDGEPEPVADIDSPPMMTTIGGGLFWGTDGTIFAATDVNAGLLFTLDPGEIPTVPSGEPAGSPVASPAASPVAAGGFEPGATAVLTAEAPLRSTPSANGTVVLELRPGAELTVVGEAVEAGGQTWVPVVEPATGAIGYVEASLLQPAGDA